MLKAEVSAGAESSFLVAAFLVVSVFLEAVFLEVFFDLALSCLRDP